MDPFRRVQPDGQWWSPGEAEPVTLDFICQDPAGCAGAPLGTVALATVAVGINPDGVIVGQYAPISGGPAHGFIAVPPRK